MTTANTKNKTKTEWLEVIESDPAVVMAAADKLARFERATSDAVAELENIEDSLSAGDETVTGSRLREARDEVEVQTRLRDRAKQELRSAERKEAKDLTLARLVAAHLAEGLGMPVHAGHRLKGEPEQLPCISVVAFDGGKADVTTGVVNKGCVDITLHTGPWGMSLSVRALLDSLTGKPGLHGGMRLTERVEGSKWRLDSTFYTEAPLIRAYPGTPEHIYGNVGSIQPKLTERAYWFGGSVASEAKPADAAGIIYARVPDYGRARAGSLPAKAQPLGEGTTDAEGVTTFQVKVTTGCTLAGKWTFSKADETYRRALPNEVGRLWAGIGYVSSLDSTKITDTSDGKRGSVAVETVYTVQRKHV